MGEIVIKCFSTLKKYYFYDRHTNSVVCVNPEVHSAEPSGLRCVSERTLCGA